VSRKRRRVVEETAQRVVKAAARNKNATEMQQQQHKGAWLKLKQQQRAQHKETTEGSGGERDFASRTRMQNQESARAERRTPGQEEKDHLQLTSPLRAWCPVICRS